MSHSPHAQRWLLVSTATYNERENLPELLQRIWQAVPHADVLVVDDNSPDGTGKWAEEYAAREPRLRVVIRPAKLGLGSAILLAIEQAIAGRYRFFAHLDADLSHDPAHLPEMLRLVEEAPEGSGPDCVIGSRYVAGGSVAGWPLRRKLMSRLVNAYARLLLRLAVRDCSGGFRLYRVEALAKLEPASIRARGYAFLEEILWHLACHGCRFAEVPIRFVDRQRGRSKINSREALAALVHMARLALRGCRARTLPRQST
ncbi:MAG: glycosyl transferase [Pirellulaceae bacterium]|nr:MAG: glycosyl transferase [Pirellulaceae bacterium]